VEEENDATHPLVLFSNERIKPAIH
jgi:hypothetical protein